MSDDRDSDRETVVVRSVCPNCDKEGGYEIYADAYNFYKETKKKYPDMDISAGHETTCVHCGWRMTIQID